MGLELKKKKGFEHLWFLVCVCSVLQFCQSQYVKNTTKQSPKDI